MSLILLQQPQVGSTYANAHGPQGDMKWSFYDDSIQIVAPTLASFEVIIPSGALTGTIKIDGITFTADNTIGASPGFTNTKFFVNATNALITAANIRGALRSNHLTAGRWQFEITGTTADAVLTATANDTGQQLRASTSGIYTINTTQATEGLLKDRLFLAYQGNIIFSNGKEVSITNMITVPPGYDYGAADNHFIPLPIDLQEAVRNYLQTPFPAVTAAVLVNEAAALVYLRYGSMEYSGCSLTAQTFTLSPEIAVINQALGYEQFIGPVEFSPNSASSDDKFTLSLSAKYGLNLTDTQFAWVYFFSNIRTFHGSSLPAYRFNYYNEFGGLISVTPIQTIPWPSTIIYKKTVASIPIGPGNSAFGSFPPGTTFVEVEIGHSTDGVAFVRQYKKYKYRIMPSGCQSHEIYFLGHLGSWESLALEEIVEETLSVNQTTARLSQKNRTWSNGSNSAIVPYADYLKTAGDSQRNTQARRRLKLRTMNLDASTGSKKIFESFLTSEDRRLLLSSLKVVNTPYVFPIKVLVVHSDSKLITDQTGRTYYEFEIEIAENLPTVATS